MAVPDFFDWKFYVESHQDLVKAGINTEKRAINHYKKYGKYEKRFLCKGVVINEESQHEVPAAVVEHVHVPVPVHEVHEVPVDVVEPVHVPVVVVEPVPETEETEEAEETEETEEETPTKTEETPTKPEITLNLYPNKSFNFQFKQK